MKNYLFLFLLFNHLSHFCQYYDLEVTIKNIQEIKGFIQIGLYNNAKEFPKVNKEYQRFYFKVTDLRPAQTYLELISEAGNIAFKDGHTVRIVEGL